MFLQRTIRVMPPGTRAIVLDSVLWEWDTTRLLSSSDIEEAAEVVSAAFLDDPLWVYLIPSGERRARDLPMGFRETENPGNEFQNREPKGERWRSARRSKDDPSGEIRMRLDIKDCGYT